MGRWVCIDYGARRIGIAAGSTGDGIACPLEVVAAEPRDRAIRAIGRIAAEYEAEGIVVGWPLNMDDTEGPQGRVARAMAGDLAAATGMDVRMWDERLSSFAADEKLAGMMTRKKRKARQDAVAAAEILQDFFACDGPDAAPRPGDAAPGPGED